MGKKAGHRLYDFKCNECNTVVEMFARFEERTFLCTKCDSKMERLFPMGAIKNFMPFEAYYDEGLDCDITGRRQHKEVMNALNVHEAGDRKHGARDFEDKNPTAIKPQSKLRGKSIDDIHRKKDSMSEAKESFAYAAE